MITSSPSTITRVQCRFSAPGRRRGGGGKSVSPAEQEDRGMNATLWLRISSIVSLLFSIGHTLGGRQDWSPPGETDVLSAMRTVHYDAMGVSRTYLDFYRAFGFSLSVTMFLQTFLLWQLASLARTQPLQARPMIAAFALHTVACRLLSWRFLFPIPTAFSFVLAACLVVAFWAAR